jgi:hypothetical protein
MQYLEGKICERTQKIFATSLRRDAHVTMRSRQRAVQRDESRR